MKLHELSPPSNSRKASRRLGRGVGPALVSPRDELALHVKPADGHVLGKDAIDVEADLDGGVAFDVVGVAATLCDAERRRKPAELGLQGRRG